MATSEPIVDIDRETGELIQGWPRCKQSIYTILTTRLRTRIMRLWWGSLFLEMQDRPGNDETFVFGIGEATRAINLYEPEFQVERVIIEGPLTEGIVNITVEGEYLPDKVKRRATFPVPV